MVAIIDYDAGNLKSVEKAFIYLGEDAKITRDREEMLSLLFRHTATLGVREAALRRHVLDRRVETLETPYGPVRRKVSAGYGVSRTKYEYDDLARVARERGLSLAEAERLLGGE